MLVFIPMKLDIVWVSSVFYLFPKKIKGGQNELVKSPKMIAMTALIRVISF